MSDWLAYVNAAAGVLIVMGLGFVFFVSRMEPVPFDATWLLTPDARVTLAGREYVTAQVEQMGDRHGTHLIVVTFEAPRPTPDGAA